MAMRVCYRRPMATFDHDGVALLGDALRLLDEGFDHLPATDARADTPAAREALLETARRLHDNYPYQHPFYIGQMLKPPHPLARTAYALAMYLNPNNHALDGSRASSPMEKEAVSGIAQMFGYSRHLGHLCGGGTMANFEALWVARQSRPGSAVAASAQAHYTHSRLSQVLAIPCHEVAVDSRGRMDLTALEALANEGGLGTVVATLGTTAAGAVDPLPGILELAGRYDFRVHVDTAYGGYFRLAGNLGADAAAAYACIDQADSIVVDPHKHGLQPYGCGCVLFRDPAVGRFYRHDSPYTYFSSEELHLGEISLECSRAGAAAVALWTTMRALPLEPDGEFAGRLERCRAAALDLKARLVQRDAFAVLFEPELDIVSFAVRAPSSSASSRLAAQIFDAAARHDVHLALASYPRVMCEGAAAVETWDGDTLQCLRACVMKGEHGDWLDEITARIDAAVAEVPG